jgi:hypothetical protein
MGAAALFAVGGCATDGSTPPVGTPVTINWTPCVNDPAFPSWFAVQDGTGAWNRVTSANGVFSFTISSGNGGVATYSGGQLTVLYATTAEIQGYAPACTGTNRTVTGTVTGYSSNQDVDIEMDGSGATVTGITPPPASFQLFNVSPGTSDVLAVRSTQSATSSTFLVTPSSVFIRRGQSASSLAAIDMNSATEASVPVSRTATIANVANNETLLALSGVITPTTSIAVSEYEVALGTVSGNVAALFYGLPSARLVAGESQQLVVVSSATLSASSASNRFVATTFSDAADKSLTLGPVLNTVTIGGSARPSASYAIQSGYDQIFQMDLDQSSGISSKTIEVIVTRGYLGASASAVTLLVPDLSGVAGFSTAWLMTPGSSATWTFYAGSDALIAGSAAQGFTAASRTGSFVP